MIGIAASALPAVIAWGRACFPAEGLREMAGFGVAVVQGKA
jgi:hypothetical protein